MTDAFPIDSKPEVDSPLLSLKFEDDKPERKPTPPNGIVSKMDREADSPGLAPLVVEKRESGRSEDQLPLIWDLREALAEVSFSSCLVAFRSSCSGVEGWGSQAQNTFITLDECTYQNKSLGASRQLEDSMNCECHWDPGALAALRLQSW